MASRIELKKISNIDIDNKSVLIRVDYNVPIIDGKIINTFRIDSSIDTIQYCLDRNCKVILMSHLGRPKENDSNYSLTPVYNYLNNVFKNSVYFSLDCISEDAINKSKNLKPKEIHLLENLRFYNEELTCDAAFSEKLSRHADIFINDAFGTAHRAHSSNVGVASFFRQKGHGLLISKEIKYLKEGIEKESQKLTLLLGGAKISDKIKLISRFENIADYILIGGAMSNNFISAKGFQVGKSLIEKDCIALAKKILEKNKDKILIPSDFVCVTDIDDERNSRIASFKDIGGNEITVDIGPETISTFKRIIDNTDCVLWNGPMGIIEKKKFSLGTEKMINIIKKITENNSISIIGGGDTSSVISMNDFNKFTHISTGGGASLKFLSGEIMPALEALKE